MGSTACWGTAPWPPLPTMRAVKPSAQAITGPLFKRHLAHFHVAPTRAGPAHSQAILPASRPGSCVSHPPMPSSAAENMNFTVPWRFLLVGRQEARHGEAGGHVGIVAAGVHGAADRALPGPVGLVFDRQRVISAAPIPGGPGAAAEHRHHAGAQPTPVVNLQPQCGSRSATTAEVRVSGTPVRMG